MWEEYTPGPQDSFLIIKSSIRLILKRTNKKEIFPITTSSKWYLHAYTYIHTYIHIHAHTHIHTYIPYTCHIHTIHIRYIHTYIHKWVWKMSMTVDVLQSDNIVYVYVVWAVVWECLCACMSMYVCICTSACVSVCTDIHMLIYSEHTSIYHIETQYVRNP